mgnify:CR=1 FL=1
MEWVWVLAQELEPVVAWVWILEWVMVRVQAQERVKELLPALTAEQVLDWVALAYSPRQAVSAAQGEY